MEREEIKHNEALSVDFSTQLRLDSNCEHVESSIFSWLQIVAAQVAKGDVGPLGAIIVLGDFDKFGPRIDGMVQMKPKQNPIESFLLIDTEDSDRYIKKFSQAPYDGAIVVNKTGQIIGAGIYLVIEDPTLDIPDDCGTRHKAAASFSLRNDVKSVLTISEETNIVRIWKDGQVQKAHRVDDQEDDRVKNGEKKE